jgi:predicted DCC family thiol-disulfide oxidoreductase YuxK
MKRDKKEQFQFVPLQSEEGKELIVRCKIPKGTDSIIVIAENRFYLESEAVIKIIGYLAIPWKWLQVLRIIPLNIRNKVYRWIAQNRFNWFGRRKTCRIM